MSVSHHASFEIPSQVALKKREGTSGIFRVAKIRKNRAFDTGFREENRKNPRKPASMDAKTPVSHGSWHDGVIRARV